MKLVLPTNDFSGLGERCQMTVSFASVNLVLVITFFEMPVVMSCILSKISAFSDLAEVTRSQVLTNY